MSLFIGIPNLDLTDSSIQVYPDHIEFGGAQVGGGVSVYLPLRDMAALGKALSDKAENAKGITSVVSSSMDATTDEVADILKSWVYDRVPDMLEDELTYKAIEIMELVADRLRTSVPGAVDESQLS